MSKDKITITGEVHIVLKDAKGNVKKEVKLTNLVTTVGKDEMAKLLASGSGFARPTHIAVGTDNTAPNVADTVLGTEILRKAIATTGFLDNKVTYTVSFLPGEATALLEEAGLFDAAAAGDMWARFLTGSFNKGANDTLDLSWALLFT